jgi:ribonuclease HI
LSIRIFVPPFDVQQI